MDFTRLEINRRMALLTSAAIAANVIDPMRSFALETPPIGRRPHCARCEQLGVHHIDITSQDESGRITAGWPTSLDQLAWLLSHQQA